VKIAEEANKFHSLSHSHFSRLDSLIRITLVLEIPQSADLIGVFDARVIRFNVKA